MQGAAAVRWQRAGGSCSETAACRRKAAGVGPANEEEEELGRTSKTANKKRGELESRRAAVEGSDAKEMQN